MKILLKTASSCLLMLVFILNAIPCGPAFITPVFDINKSPEFPYEEFAAGRVGIVRTTFNRSVLFGAYRYVTGSGFNAEEQKALVDVWRAEFNNRDFRDNDVEEAVTAWVERRKSVVGKDEKLPKIYVEREYGGYDFFPNCTKNAFETATETLNDRISSYGSEDVFVKDWVNAQDSVFANCASGEMSPQALPAAAPEWLVKDRAYQMAAASFYSLRFDDAKQRFAAIALDYDSPWRETADYLVARTLIRQASLSGNEGSVKRFYIEAEDHLKQFVSTTGKFSDSAERLLGLVKFRLRPEERVRELAMLINQQSSGANLRQELIDYTWLLNGFQAKALKAEDARLKPPGEVAEPEPKSDWEDEYEKRVSGQVISFWIDNVPQASDANSNAAPASNTFNFPADKPVNEIIREVESTLKRTLSANEISRIEDAVVQAYQNRTTYTARSDDDGAYSGDVELTVGILPEFLMQDDLTDWLYTYQITTEDAYTHSLEKYKASNSDHWLMAAISKANRSSAGLAGLLEAAGRSNRTSPAYPTIAYHHARLLLDQGKTAEADKIVESVLTYSAELPSSTMNEFARLRQRTSTSLDDYLKYSLLKPFGFDYGGSVGTISSFIEDQKKWYDPKYNKETREEFERKTEEQFAQELLRQDRLMFDGRTVSVMNYYFPTSVLVEAYRSPSLPDYVKAQLALSIWTRASLLKNKQVADSFAPIVINNYPFLEEPLEAVRRAANPLERDNALLYLMVKNPILTPYIDDGFGKTDNEANVWEINDWWCSVSDDFYDEEKGDMVSMSTLPKPSFLSVAQVNAASVERKLLNEIGDAPGYLARKTLDWARRSPNDARVPEALYLMHKANGWSKWSCAGDIDLQKEIGTLLKTRYPNNHWAQTLIKDEAEEGEN